MFTIKYKLLSEKFIFVSPLLSFVFRSSRELQQAMDASSRSGEPLDSHLYTNGCPPVDLLVRTSGERRLSDFMLVQSTYALLVFTGVLWPDFGFLDLVSAIMQYQRSYAALQAAREAGARALVALAARRKVALVRSPQRSSLPALKLRRDEGDADSPCGVATPGSVSSPSSGSASGSEQELPNSESNTCNSAGNKKGLLLQVEATLLADSKCPLHRRKPYTCESLERPS